MAASARAGRGRSPAIARAAPAVIPLRTPRRLKGRPDERRLGPDMAGSSSSLSMMAAALRTAWRATAGAVKRGEGCAGLRVRRRAVTGEAVEGGGGTGGGAAQALTSSVRGPR